MFVSRDNSFKIFELYSNSIISIKKRIKFNWILWFKKICLNFERPIETFKAKYVYNDLEGTKYFKYSFDISSSESMLGV